MTPVASWDFETRTLLGWRRPREPFGLTLPLVIGQFELYEEIACGGFGRVYRARQLGPTELRAAVKVIDPRFLPPADALRSFQEARALGRLQHRGIVQVLGAGEHSLSVDGHLLVVPWLAMQLLSGKTVLQYVKERSLSFFDQLELFECVAEGVAAAHFAPGGSIVHGDLKPSNVLMDGDGAASDSRPRLIDFGLTPQAGATASPGYSIAYAAPEQLRNEPPGVRSDVYSLAVLGFRMFSNGRWPYLIPGASFDYAVSEHEQLQFRQNAGICSLRAGGCVPRRRERVRLLDDVLSKALSRDPGDRHADARELLDDIRRIRSGQSTSVYPKRVFERVRFSLWRHRVAATIFAVLTVGAVGTVIFGVRARQAAAAASVQEALAQQNAVESGWNAYVARLESAGRALGANDHAAARSLLDSCPPAIRGWEWHVLDAELEEAIKVHKFARGVNTVAVSRDAKWTAAGLDDGHIALHNARDDSPPTLLLGHDGAVVWTTFSQDSHYLVSASQDKTAKLWTVQGACTATFRGHTDGVTHAFFTPDGARVVTGSKDGTVAVWSASTGDRLKTLEGPDRSVACLTLAPDGRTIAIGSVSGKLRLSSIEGDEHTDIPAHGAMITAVSYATDGTCFVTASVDGRALVWEARTARLMGELPNNGSYVIAVDVAAEEGWIATGTSDGTVRVWNSTNYHERWSLRGHSDAITGLSHTFGILTSAGRDGTVRVWDIENGRLLDVLRGHTAAVWQALWSDSATVVTASADGSSRVFKPYMDTTNWSRSADSEQLYCIMPSSRMICAFGTFAGSADIVRMWGDAFGTAGLPSDKPDEPGRSIAAKFLTCEPTKLGPWVAAPDHSWLAAFDRDGHGVIVSTRSGSLLARLAGHTGRVNAIAVSDDGARLFSASDDKTVRVWHTPSGRLLMTLHGHDQEVGSLEYMATFQCLLSTSTGGQTLVWDARRLRDRPDGKSIPGLMHTHRP